MRRLLFALLLALGLATSAGASHIAASLVAETDAPRPGTQIMLALRMQPAPQWHGYWENPGDAGVATRIAWTMPAGVKAAPLRYPVPQTLLIAGLMNYVYERDYALLTSVAIPGGLAPGTRLPLRAAVDWLACNPQTCVPEHGMLALDLKVGGGAITPDRRAAFDRWRAALPRPLGSPARYQIAQGRLRLAVPLPAAVTIDQPYFFPTTDGVVDYAAPQTVQRDRDRLVVETAARPSGARALAGVLRIGPDTGLMLTATPGTVAPAPAGGSGGSSLWLASAGALIGGLLLNIMPCVFPILSLKALSLARSGRSEAEARREALAYAAGVILVCAGLGAVLLGLRAAGGAAGWAFQLQDARVIAALLLLVTAIALNLAGLFELPVLGGGGRLAGADGIGGAFWTGALAAFVATPCSGPFLGTALGAALLLPFAGAMAIFVGLGIGLALPFLALGFIPALRRLMPRPGGWMNHFRHVLAIPMLLTALGLAWVLGREAGVDAMAIGLAAATMLAIGLWWAGLRQAAGKDGPWWPVLAALLIAGALVAIVRPTLAAAPGSIASGSDLAFSDAALAKLRGEHRPVFLYFTADWCLTCKVNEGTAIDRSEVKAAFARHNVAVMVGDWTRGDPAISRFLAAHGRSGVPFYLYYPAGGGEPRELPQLLTPGLLAGLAQG